MKFELNSEMKRKLLQVLLIAAIKEAYFWICKDQDVLNTILKVVAGAAIFLICYGIKNRPYKTEQKLILIAASCYIIADILILWVFIASGILFALGHLLLIIAFWLNRKPGKTGIIVWAVLTAIEAPLVIILLPKALPSLTVIFCCLIAFYGSLLIMMACSVAYQQKTVAVAGFMFLVSDLFLVLSKAVAVIEWIHAPCILLFYLSIGLFLLHCAGTDQYK